MNLRFCEEIYFYFTNIYYIDLWDYAIGQWDASQASLSRAWIRNLVEVARELERRLGSIPKPTEIERKVCLRRR